MKNNKIDCLESLVKKEFHTKTEFAPPSGWQNEVIADIKRRDHAKKFNTATKLQALLQPRLVWRFAAASVTLATLICIALYLTVPDNNSNDYQITEASFDNFDNYIEMIAQL
jgi:type IV secretory pathway component VirB8